MDIDDAGSVTSTAWLNLRGKALPDQTVELLSILQDILERARLDNRGRFQQLVLEEKASLESRLVPAGSSYVDRRLRASLYESDWADEQMGGVSYLFFLRKLADDAETNWEEVLAALERTKVNYVGKGADLYREGIKPSGAHLVARHYLRTTWLWDKIRGKAELTEASASSIAIRAALPSFVLS